MSRDTGSRNGSRVSSRRRSTRPGSTATAVVAATVGFAVVVGALYFVTAENKPEDDSRDGGESVAASSTKTEATLPDAVKAPVAVAAVDPQPRASGAHTNEAAAANTAVDPAEGAVEVAVKAHLAAGEFGPAVDAAERVADVKARAALLRVVADAQFEAGEFVAARGTIARMPRGEQRVQARGEGAARQSLAGGGAQADFTELIELIQTNTSGPWEEIDGTGGTMTPFFTGVHVDPDGVLALASVEDQTASLRKLGVNARKADLNDDMAKSSPLRLVSLNRLQEEAAKRVLAGKPVVESMKRLAGLSRLQYVFFDHAANDVILGGPAEAWRYDERGLPMGVESGRPTLALDDFVTVFRAFNDGSNGEFSCLIVPRKESLAAVDKLVREFNSRGPLTSGGTRNYVNRLESTLGMQDVVVNGVPLDSRVARVIVEADYRMKLIGIDKLHGTLGVPSYFDLLETTGPEPASSGVNANRWWMTMKYDAILHSPERDAFQFQGSSVKCLAENEKITSEGDRIHTGKADPTNTLFAQNFTENYEKLAAADVVFADMQNIFDLALAAALATKEDREGRIDFDAGVFAQSGAYNPDKYESPREVPTAANHRVYKGKEIVIQAAGGVHADLMAVATDKDLLKFGARLDNLARRAAAPQLPAGRWWWDAAR